METLKVADGGAPIPPPPRPPAFGAPRPELTATWSAPLAAPKRPAAASDPVRVLDEVVTAVEGVRGALLASVDGFGLAHSSGLTDEPAHPAMLAAAVGLAHQLASMGGGGVLHQLVVEHDHGLVLVWPAGSTRVLAVLAASTTDQPALRRAVDGRLASLAGAVR